jgi:hypothetical protein
MDHQECVDSAAMGIQHFVDAAGLLAYLMPCPPVESVPKSEPRDGDCEGNDTDAVNQYASTPWFIEHRQSHPSLRNDC